MSTCAFYSDGEHAWEVGFERKVGTPDSHSTYWATSEFDHLADDLSFKAAKRCRCVTVVYQRPGTSDEMALAFEALARAFG